MLGIGVSVGVAGQGPLEDLRVMLDRLVSIGYTHAELSAKGLAVSIGGELNAMRLERLRAAIEGVPLGFTLHGTEISSSRGGNLMDPSTPAQRQIFSCDLELAGAIGASILVYHSGTMRDPYGDDRALAAGMAAERDALREFGDRAAELGVTIAVENRDPNARYLVRRVYGMDLIRLAEQVDAVNHPSVKICLDTGHAFLSYTYLEKGVKAYLDDIRHIAPLVGHIHLTDNFGQVSLDIQADYSERLPAGDGDLHLPPKWGNIPLDEVFSTPFPLLPTVNLEIQSRFFEHLDYAFHASKRLVSNQP